MVVPVERTNLRNSLVRSVFEAIVKGEFKPGDRVLEGPLARQLGVAQTSLREALQDLEYQGLVTKYGNRGTYITDISLEEFDQLYSVRKRLEPYAASLARARMTSAAHEQLSEVLKKMHTAGKNHDFLELALVDLEFHQLIWHLSGNRWLERALRLVGPPQLAFVSVSLYRSPTYNFEKFYWEHKSLLTALNTGTPDDAKTVFEDMLEIFRTDDIRNLRALRQNSNDVTVAEHHPPPRRRSASKPRSSK